MGTWGGDIDGLEQRWVFEPARVTIANKCDDQIVGIVVAAKVTSTEIEMLEAKDAGSKKCHAASKIGKLETCAREAPPCFEHDGKRLRMRATDDRYFELVKLAD